jgi:glyoxylase-like metal-dependent hydrolase (beta-lactamase superfamily II)
VAGLLRQARDPNRPLPQVTFDDKLTVAAGEDRIELAYHGPNHSPGNIFAYLPAQRVLMLVDVVFGSTSSAAPMSTPRSARDHVHDRFDTDFHEGSLHRQRAVRRDEFPDRAGHVDRA